VRRQILCDEKPAEVLLARVTDVHMSPFRACGLASVGVSRVETLRRRYELTHS
jgi:hypothetical protein